MIQSTFKKSNILILDNELGVGGSERLMVDFVKHFDRNRFAVKICCLKEGGYFKNVMVELGVPVFEKLLRHKYDVLAFRRLARIIKEESIDLIDTYAHANTVIFSYMAKVSGLVKGFVVGFHAMGGPTGQKLIPAYVKPFLDGADVFVACANRHKQYLAEIEGLPAARIEVIHNGVDTTKFHPAEPGNGKQLREQLGINRAETVLTSVASLKPVKCVDVLLKASADPVRGRKDTRILIVGDGPERNNLEALAADLGMRERVIFTGIREDVDEILRISDILVLASRTETFPTVVLEAMASGLPVITTDVGSVREMVEENNSAVVVPYGDPYALSTAIKNLLEDKEKATRYGERGRSIVTEKFRVETMCEKREQLLARVISNKS